MKINLLNYNNPYLSGSTPVHKDPQMFKERFDAGLCDKNDSTRGYNVNFSGGQKESGPAAKTLGEKILSSKTFGSILEYAEAHPISCQALFALVLAGILRPLTILALSGDSEKEKKDSRNAAAHAVASGVIGFVSSTIIMSPFDAAMKRVKNDPAKYLGKAGKKAESYLGDLKAKGLTKTQKFKNVETLMKMGPDIVIGIPRSIITIALIPPILKYVFGIDPKSKQKKTEEAKPEQKPENINTMQYAGASIKSAAFGDFNGGAK